MKNKAVFYFVIVLGVIVFCTWWTSGPLSRHEGNPAESSAGKSAESVGSVPDTAPSPRADTSSTGTVTTNTTVPNNISGGEKVAREVQMVDMSEEELVALNLRDSEAYMRHMQQLRRLKEGAPIAQLSSPEEQRVQARERVHQRLGERLGRAAEKKSE